ncbi:MAG: hypothetical protein HFI80_07825 [Lachnospiraceae bacterium]|jgi:hypothetical protein|nr:hypothetical protein [Lachnospiraceae bacterium]MCI9661436.1 hypothetical protein [Lachnospiraceae bacterium]
MKTDIQEHYDSIQFKKALQELHITNVSELKEEGYIAPDINGYDAYQNQPLEFTARAFARDEVERIYSYIE